MKKQVQEIKEIIMNNIVRVYQNDIEGLKKSMNDLNTEFRRNSDKKLVEKYEYLLEDKEQEGDIHYYTVKTGSNTYSLQIRLYENGKAIDMRNKKVKEFKTDFKYNKYVKAFEKVVVL